jgi:TATA-binding protein-associated factor Taf7
VALPAGEQIDRTNRLLASQIAEHERVIAEATEKLNSFWTTPGKRKRLRDDIRHARVMIAGLSKMRPAVNDPANY